MAKTRVRIPKIDMKAFLIYLREQEACPKAINWVRRNRNKTPKQLFESAPKVPESATGYGGDTWYTWLKSELGISYNAPFEQVMKELAQEIEKYTPAGSKKAKEEDVKIRKDLKDWVKDANTLMEKAEKMGIFYHLDLYDVQRTIEKLETKYELDILVQDIKEGRQ